MMLERDIQERREERSKCLTRNGFVQRGIKIGMQFVETGRNT